MSSVLETIAEVTDYMKNTQICPFQNKYCLTFSFQKIDKWKDNGNQKYYIHRKVSEIQKCIDILAPFIKGEIQGQMIVLR